jgi:hypothetical protein
MVLEPDLHLKSRISLAIRPYLERTQKGGKSAFNLRVWTVAASASVVRTGQGEMCVPKHLAEVSRPASWVINLSVPKWRGKYEAYFTHTSAQLPCHTG